MLTDYVLSETDVAIIEATTARVTDEQRDQIIEIHRTRIAKDIVRREEIMREVNALDRAIAMRELSIKKLTGG